MLNIVLLRTESNIEIVHEKQSVIIIIFCVTFHSRILDLALKNNMHPDLHEQKLFFYFCTILIFFFCSEKKDCQV